MTGETTVQHPEESEAAVSVEEEEEGLVSTDRPKEGEEWQYRLFDCMSDVGMCLDITFCMYCALSRQWSVVVTKQVDNMQGAVCCGAFFLDQLLKIGGISCALTMCLRARIRKKYGLRGTPREDCLASFCCIHCVLCQQQKELIARGLPPGHTCCPSTTTARPVVIQMGMPAIGSMASRSESFMLYHQGIFPTLSSQQSFMLYHQGI
eukprot:Sspe_Gene.54189::Locus_29920_Transcript_1_1_Confidence_1.000_Length_657::g.54189::m.54189